MAVSISRKAAACIAATVGMTNQALGEPETIIVNGANPLVVNELLDANVTIEANGELSGAGGITGLVTNNGTVAPGEGGIGGFVIFNGFQQSSSGLLNIDVSDVNGNDDLLVFGTISLGGSVSLNPMQHGDGFSIGDTRTILLSEESIEGSITGLTVSNDLLSRAFIRPSIAVDGNQLIVSFDQLSFVSNNFNSNQIAIGTALDESLGQASGELTEFAADLGLVSLAETAAPLEQLVPEGAAVLSTASIRSSQMFHAEVEKQAARGIDSAKTDGWIGWASAFGGFAENSRQNQGAVSEFDYDIYGVVVGADRSVGKSGRLGFAVGVSKAEIDISGQPKEAEQKSIQASVYVTYFQDNYRLSGALSAGYNDIETERHIAFASGTPTVTGDSDGYVFAGSTELAYLDDINDMRFEGFVGFDVHSAHQDGYSERGAGSLGFDIRSKTETSVRSRVGARVNFWKDVANTKFKPHLKAAWVHEFSYDENEVSGQFRGLSATRFTVEGASPAEDFAEIDAGFNYQLSQNSAMYAGYTGLIGSNETVHGFSAGFTFAW
ncbi:autotransporter family protein [Kordiimonas aquimaris]|uniref:autotransporter family protein n=1 Tax=Kordiimonas aquimaris TaxID=707591 RepID=UPI0021D07F6E|nr:autotransporter outer membrane beta-barrel domain-containing protein [Kordiimonas aquimaris]